MPLLGMATVESLACLNCLRHQGAVQMNLAPTASPGTRYLTDSRVAGELDRQAPLPP